MSPQTKVPMGVPPSLYTYIRQKIYTCTCRCRAHRQNTTNETRMSGREAMSRDHCVLHNGRDTIYHCGVIPGIYSTVDLLTTMRLTQTPIPTLSWWDWSCHPTRPPTPGEKDHSLVARLRQTNASIQACDAQQSPVEMKPPHSKTTHTYPQGRQAEPAKHDK